MNPTEMLRLYFQNSNAGSIIEHWHRLAFLESVSDPASFQAETGELLPLAGGEE